MSFNLSIVENYTHFYSSEDNFNKVNILTDFSTIHYNEKCFTFAKKDKPVLFLLLNKTCTN